MHFADEYLRRAWRSKRARPRGECCGESFVVRSESAESCEPSERSVHDPAAWQQNETSFGFSMLDDLPVDHL